MSEKERAKKLDLRGGTRARMVQVDLEIMDGFARRRSILREQPWRLKRRTNVAVTQAGYGVLKMARRTTLIDLEGLFGMKKVD